MLPEKKPRLLDKSLLKGVEFPRRDVFDTNLSYLLDEIIEESRDKGDQPYMSGLKTVLKRDNRTGELYVIVGATSQL